MRRLQTRDSIVLIKSANKLFPIEWFYLQFWTLVVILHCEFVMFRIYFILNILLIIKLTITCLMKNSDFEDALNLLTHKKSTIS